MRLRKYVPWIVTILLLSLLWLPVSVRALTNPPPTLGATASTFAVLGASTVTNTGPTIVQGNLGVSPGSSVTGFPPGVVSGAIFTTTNSLAATAQGEANAASINAGQQPCDVTLTGQDLGGLAPLTPKVYCFASTATLTGQLTLDGTGDPNGIFIFKIGTALDATPGSRVVLINVNPCNIFWQVGSAATLDTTASFAGNILAGTSITLLTGASSNGGLFALTGAVTLQSNNVQTCSAPIAAPTSTATSTSVPSNTPTSTATSTSVPSNTPTSTATSSATSTATPTSSVTGTSVPSNTPTNTPVLAALRVLQSIKLSHYGALTSGGQPDYCSRCTLTDPKYANHP